MIFSSRNFRILSSIVVLSIGFLVLNGCASRQELEDATSTIETLEEKNEEFQNQIAELQGNVDDLEKEIKKLERRREILREENQWLRNQLEERKNQLKDRKSELNRTRETIRQNEKTIESLRERITQLEEKRQERIRKLREQNRQLEKDLSEIKEATTRREGENVVITLESRILFDLGDHELRDDAKETLEEISKVLAEYQNRPIVVEGHTDTVPVLPDSQFPTNWHLSAARAVTVVQNLTNQHGLDPDRLAATGYGEHRPVKPNTTEKNRQQNRRVEIVLYPPDWQRKQVSPEELDKP